MKNFRSVISGLFFGLIYTKITCSFCNTSFYNYQTFNFLIFPLKKVLQYKLILANNISNHIVTIEDCFKHYQLSSTLNDYYCNKCKNTGNCKYSNKFSILPNYIIIILNRGKGLEYKVNFALEKEKLELKDYAEYCKKKNQYMN